VLTNSRGILAEPMADWAVASIGFCLRGFHEAVAAQRAHRWAKPAFTDGSVRVRELAGTRVGIVGLGSIGAAVARRCARLGMEVRGVRRRPERRRPAGVRWVGGPKDLRRLARMSDVLVIAAPHTADTRHAVDGHVLDALPQGAFVLNLSRGALLDEGALLARLEGGTIGGCVFDVLAQEPPSPRHPFWDHPRVLLTPHVSGVSERFWERETGLILENVRRYRAGRSLRNVVDLHAGY
ncbi:MAG: NAD(P)-binding domain-containing protein, partial [Gemmatimonadales bacterium]|nr:NAD(P)-binding domain-containing protein [Gemmatimonadales bacterium]